MSEPTADEKIHAYLVSGAFGQRARDMRGVENDTRAFYKSARFWEILNYIKDNDVALDCEDMRHFPEKHPIAVTEMEIFCDSIMQFSSQKARNVTEKFSEHEIVFEGVIISLLKGQGANFSARKADAAPKHGRIKTKKILSQ